MNTIWKFTLSSETIIDLPRNAEVLSVHNQYGNVCLWVKVDNTQQLESRKFVMCCTGGSVPDEPTKFIGTVLLASGDLVLHVFEIITLKS